MTLFATLILITLTATPVQAVDPSLTWNTFVGNTGQHLGYAADFDSSGNVYTVGLSNSAWSTSDYGSPLGSVGYQGGASDGVLVKLNSSGEVQWYKFFGGSSNDALVNIHVDGSNNIYVVGYAFGALTNVGCTPVHAYIGGDTDMFVAKLDTDGAITWCTYLGSLNNDYPWTVDTDAVGNVYIGGESYSKWHTDFNNVVGTDKSSNGYQGVITRLNSSGAYVWHRYLTTYRVYDMEIVGTVLYTVKKGSFFSGGWNYPAEVGRYNANTGSQGWSTQIGSGSHDGFGIAVDSDRNIYVRGHSNATWGTPVRSYTSYNDVYIAKLNNSGTLLWNTFLGGSGNDQSRANQTAGIVFDSEGDVYVSGFSSATWGSPLNSFSGTVDGFAAKVNSSGVLQWLDFYGGSGSDWLVDIGIDSSDNLVLAGFTQQTSWGTPVDFPTGCYYCWSLVEVSNPLNTDPVMTAMDDSTVAEGAVITITGTCTDDDSGDTLTITTSQTGGTSCGSLSGSPDSGSGGSVDSSANCTAPSVNSNTDLTFSTSCNDGTTTNADTVTVTVNAAPTATPQTVTLTEDSVKSITLSGSDPSDSISSYTVLTNPTKGSLSGTAPNLTYTPDRDANGQDSFTFMVNDGLQDSGSATVTLSITAQNDAPVITSGNDVEEIDVPTVGSYIDLPEITASDADNDSITYNWQQISGNSILEFIDNDKIDLSSSLKKGSYYIQMVAEDSNGSSVTSNPVRVDIPNNSPQKIEDYEDVLDAQWQNSVYVLDDFIPTIEVDTIFTDIDGDVISLTWSLDEPNSDLASFLSTSSDGSCELKIRKAGQVIITIEASDGDGGTTTEEIVLDIPVPNVSETNTQTQVTSWSAVTRTAVNVTGTLRSPVWPVVILNNGKTATVTLSQPNTQQASLYNTTATSSYETYTFMAENVDISDNELGQLNINTYTDYNGQSVNLLEQSALLTDETNSAGLAVQLDASAGCSLNLQKNTAHGGFYPYLIIYIIMIIVVRLHAHRRETHHSPLPSHTTNGTRR